MARSKSRNRAGAQLVVDRVVELKKRTSMPSVIAQAQSLQSQFSSKFSQVYSLIIEGSREVSEDGHVLTAKIYKDGTPQNYGEFMDGDNFSWRIEDGESKTGNSLHITSDDIESSPTTITCTWKHNYTLTENQTGVMGSGLAALATNIQVTWAEIVQYLWSDLIDEDEIKQLPDSYWNDIKTNPPNNNLYLWRRTSKDNGSTWTYFRESGLNGTNGWSSFNLTLYKRSETEPATFDGGDLTYTFATNSLEGNLGTWSRDIPTDSTDPVWAIYALAFAQTATDTIPSVRWTSPARLSTEGTAGAKGDSVVTIFIFQKSETKPATPTANVSYNLTSGEISNISPWSKNVPAGSERVWVSLATGVTNSDSIVILPARWSSPEIFREKGDTGKGIQSVTTYYLVSAQNTGITRDTEGWSTTPQTTTSTLKYLWQYTETLWTDESKTYTEPIITGTHGEQGAQGEPGKDGADGEDGKDGADAPQVQIQYAWGLSNSKSPKFGIWFFDKKFFIWKGKFVGVKSQWSSVKKPKPENGLWYEWIRWSSDGGQTWTKPQCITSNYVVYFDIEISPATYAMTSRQYVKTLQVLTLHCRKTNYVGSSQAVWTIPAKETTADGETTENYLSFSNADGSELYDGNTRTGDTVYVAVQEGCMMTSFPVKCSLEGLGEKELAVAGSYDAFKSEYIGTVDATIDQSFPTFIEGKGPVLAGDMVVYIWQNAEGTKIANYYVCIDPTKPNTEGWSPYAEDTHHNSQLMISGIYDAIMSGADNADMIRMIENLVAHYIAAQFIRITGAIYGGSFNSDGSNPSGGMGFHISKDGLLNAYSAILKQVSIISTDYENKTVLETKQAIKASSYTFEGSTPTCFKTTNIEPSDIIKINGIPCNKMSPSEYFFESSYYYGYEVKRSIYLEADQKDPRTLIYTVQHNHSFILLYHPTSFAEYGADWSVSINNEIIKNGTVYAGTGTNLKDILLCKFSASANDNILINISKGWYISLICIADGYNAFNETFNEAISPYAIFLSDDTQQNRDIIGYCYTDYCEIGSSIILKNDKSIEVSYTKEPTGILSDMQSKLKIGELHSLDSSSLISIGDETINVKSVIIYSYYAEFITSNNETIVIDDNHFAYGISISILGEISRVIVHRLVIDDDEGSIGTGADPIPNIHAENVNLQALMIEKTEGSSTISYKINSSATQIYDFYNEYSSRFVDYVPVTLSGNTKVAFAKMWATVQDPVSRYFLGLYDSNYNLLKASDLGFSLTNASGNDPYKYYSATLGSFVESRGSGAIAYYVSSGFTLQEEKINTKMILNLPQSPTSSEISKLQKGQAYIDSNGFLKIRQ